MKTLSPLEVLTTLFGDNRAEWPPEHFRDLFVEPSYFNKLESKRPGLLVGGRGTGKTTTLRSLRFDATLERLETHGRSYGDQAYLGIFVRMNKNRVRAFQGQDLDEDTWRIAFCHYFNLQVCSELCCLTKWLEARMGSRLSEPAIGRICLDLALDLCSTIDELTTQIALATSRLQVYVNNPKTAVRPLLSMAEVPLRAFAGALRDEGLVEDRTIFCCIDEYENLLDSQQAAVNTYIKHSEPPLSYKIGVRQNGLRNRRTLDGNDLLQTPDDYRQIDIAEEGFESFAKEVARLRLLRARALGAGVPETLEEFLEELSFKEEAVRLGADRVKQEMGTELASNPDIMIKVAEAHPAEAFFIKYWSESEGLSLHDAAIDWMSRPVEWANRLNNYGYSSLFWLSHGRKGARIRKYYCGTRILLALASGNIRYFLELIECAVAEELSGATGLEGPLPRLSAKAQTLAAREVGRRRLNMLEGLAEHGVELKRLVLAVGKVLFELARSPLGKTPEVTSFVVEGSRDECSRIAALLEEGVSYLAFESSPRTKATSEAEMKDDEYRLHPIFCAFFEISHRRKRRMVLQADHLLGVLGDRPGQSITHMLNQRPQLPAPDLPEQLAFFSSFFDAGAE